MGGAVHRLLVQRAVRLVKVIGEDTGFSVKTLRTDGGGEYINDQFSTYLSIVGIERQVTTARTPQQNGVAERANRTIMEAAHSWVRHPDSTLAVQRDAHEIIRRHVGNASRELPVAAWTARHMVDHNIVVLRHLQHEQDEDTQQGRAEASEGGKHDATRRP